MFHLAGKSKVSGQSPVGLPGLLRVVIQGGEGILIAQFLFSFSLGVSARAQQSPRPIDNWLLPSLLSVPSISPLQHSIPIEKSQ